MWRKQICLKGEHWCYHGGKGDAGCCTFCYLSGIPIEDRICQKNILWSCVRCRCLFEYIIIIQCQTFQWTNLGRLGHISIGVLRRHWLRERLVAGSSASHCTPKFRMYNSDHFIWTSVSVTLRLRLRQCLFNQNRYRYHIRFTKNITIYNNHIFLIYNESNARWETSIKVISDRWHGGHPKRNSMHTQWENT